MLRAAGELKETKEKLVCQDSEAAPASPPEALPGRSYMSISLLRWSRCLSSLAHSQIVGEDILFFSNRHPSAYDVPAVSLSLITAVKKEKGFLSRHFKEKLLLLLVYSRVVSLNCQSGCQILPFLFAGISSFRGFLMVSSSSIAAQTQRWTI